jgi:hypothetical protein
MSGATTTISLSKSALKAGRAMAKKNLRSFSAQVEHLIREEAERRRIQVASSPNPRKPAA